MQSFNFDKLIDSMYQIIQFIRFYFLAIGKHRVHSPFVYSFIENVLEDQRWFYAFDEIEFQRKALAKIDLKIKLKYNIQGAKKQYDAYTLKSLIKTSVLNPYKCRVLFRTLEFLELKKGLELGSSIGISSSYLAKAVSPGILYCMTENAALCDLANKVHKSLNITNCNNLCKSFNEIMEETQLKFDEADFVFINGIESSRDTVRYFEQVLPFLHEKSIIIINDIYRSGKIHEDWQRIKSNKKVTLSIDLFYFGIVFFSPDFKERQNFRLKSDLMKILTK